jgi:hypothetical protein
MSQSLNLEQAITHAITEAVHAEAERLIDAAVADIREKLAASVRARLAGIVMSVFENYSADRFGKDLRICVINAFDEARR